MVPTASLGPLAPVVLRAGPALLVLPAALGLLAHVARTDSWVPQALRARQALLARKAPLELPVRKDPLVPRVFPAVFGR